jgi:hypothetical protein
LDAGDASITQPGVNRAELLIGSDTPYLVKPIGVAMTATPPATWGEITGTVTGVDCAGKATPLVQATVQVDTWAASRTVETDNVGRYAYWLDERSNPVSLLVAKNSWRPQSRRVTITAGQATTADWTLKLVRSC